MDAVAQGVRRAPLLLLAALLAGCSSPTAVVTAPPTFPPPLVAATTKAPAELAVIPYAVSPRVTGIQRPACTARAGGMLPDPVCTPGAVGSTDFVAVCAAGFSDAHRPDVRRARAAAMAAYHVPPADVSRVEYDHLVPLSLGGANDVSNLWPQVSDLPHAGIHNSKDDVEYRLWRAVCVARRVSLSDVQSAMARDWTGAEKFLGLAPA